MFFHKISSENSIFLRSKFQKFRFRFPSNDPGKADTTPRDMKDGGPVEEKFGEQNFRVLSEMRILAKIMVVILDLVG